MSDGITDGRRREMMRLVERDYDQASDFIRSIAGTISTTRGWSVTVWLAVLGVAISQSSAALAALAGVVLLPFLLLDLYYSWLYDDRPGRGDAGRAAPPSPSRPKALYALERARLESSNCIAVSAGIAVTSARSSVVNGSFRGPKERRSFKPKVAGSTPVGRMDDGVGGAQRPAGAGPGR